MRPYSIMLLSFHGRLLQDPTRIPALLTGLREVGIEAVEPATGLFVDQPQIEADFPAAVADAGLGLSCFDAIANLVHPDAAARQAAVDSVRRDLDRCQRWGINRAMVAGSRVHPELAPVDCRRLVAEGMNACLEHARPAGITLLVESFGVDLELHASSAQLAEVMGQCDPAVQTTFDMGNFVLGGDVPVEALEFWFHRVRHVHVKDFRRLPAGDTGGLPSRDGHRYAGCPLGQGAVDVPAVVALLRQRGYDGALSLEMGGGDELAEVRADLETLKRAAEGIKAC